MWPRLWFLFVTGFFVAMNVLLWRSEYGRRAIGSPVPPETVWRRLLESSAGANLEIRHRGQRLGSCEWRPSILELPVGGDSSIPEGMVRQITGYRLDLERGSIYLKEFTHVGFDFDLTLRTNYDVQRFQANLSVRFRSEPRLRYTIRADADKQELSIRPPLTDEGEGRGEQVITFAELRDPDRLLRRLGGPLVAATLTSLGLSLSQFRGSPASLGLQWQAHKGHRVPMGRARVPVYRLQARWLERYELNLYVAESGEIVRVDLPDELVLLNGKLTTL